MDRVLGITGERFERRLSRQNSIRFRQLFIRHVAPLPSELQLFLGLYPHFTERSSRFNTFRSMGLVKRCIKKAA